MALPVRWLFKFVWYTIWGTFRALFSCCSRHSKFPDLSADVCVVTGAGQGLGREIALLLAAECGATLVLWDIDGEKVRSVAGEIRESGGDAHPYVVDCSKREEVYRVAAQVREEVGDVAVLINNAGVMIEGCYVNGQLTDEQILKTFSVNILAHFWSVRAFLPWMMENDYGYIVNIASGTAHLGYPGYAAYSATKAAVRSFTESLRYELLHKGKEGISLTCVFPRQMSTPMLPRAVTEVMEESGMPPLPPKDVARAIVRGMGEKKLDVFSTTADSIFPLLRAVVPQRAIDVIPLELEKMLDAARKKDK